MPNANQNMAIPTPCATARTRRGPLAIAMTFAFRRRAPRGWSWSSPCRQPPASNLLWPRNLQEAIHAPGPGLVGQGSSILPAARRYSCRRLGRPNGLRGISPRWTRPSPMTALLEPGPRTCRIDIAKSTANAATGFVTGDVARRSEPVTCGLASDVKRNASATVSVSMGVAVPVSRTPSAKGSSRHSERNVLSAAWVIATAVSGFSEALTLWPACFRAYRSAVARRTTSAAMAFATEAAAPRSGPIRCGAELRGSS
jgi:hypothetical protein